MYYEYCYYIGRFYSLFATECDFFKKNLKVYKVLILYEEMYLRIFSENDN